MQVRGIGRATALAYARCGGTVVAADIDGAAATATADAIAASGGRALAIKADIAKAADIDAMVARSAEHFGRLDLLFNNAFGVLADMARGSSRKLLDLPAARWHHVIQVGLTALAQAMQAALPIMRTQASGAIVTTSSVAHLRADAGTAAYNVPATLPVRPWSSTAE